MKRAIFFSIVILCMSVCPGIVKSQGADKADEPRLRYGLFLHYGLNKHISSFNKLPDVPICCPLFEEGDGDGFSFGFLFEYPVTNWLQFALRGGLFNYTGLLVDSDTTSVLIDDVLTRGEFEYRINATLTTFSLEPQVKLRLIKGLYIHGGVNAGIYLSKDFEQKESIVEPKDRGVFVDTETRDRNVKTGEIPKIAGLNAALIAGISYELPLNKNGSLIAAPELFYSYGLTDIVEGLDWKVNSLRGGIAVKYSPVPYVKPVIKDEYRRHRTIDTIEIIRRDVLAENISNGEASISYDTLLTATRRIISENYFRVDTLFMPLPKSDKSLECNIRSVAFDDDNELPDATMLIEEFRYTNIQPLLNFIFFDENSSEIPGRYTLLDERGVEKFDMNSLFKLERLPTYYNVLNIIATRMQEHPKAKLVITGCNSGTGPEKNNRELSKERAEKVAGYFTDVWKINPDRIKVKSRGLPLKASNSNEEDGVAENRRVEITSNMSEIIAHVISKDTLRVATPPGIRFYASATPDSLLKAWKISAWQERGRDDIVMLKEFDGGAENPGTNDWKLNEEKRSIPSFSEPIHFRLEAENADGESFASQTGKINLELKTIMDKHINRAGDKKIDHYSFILFDFDKKTLNRTNSPMVDFINSRLEDKSVVMIEGYTDRIGEEEYNMELARGRAKTVFKALKAKDKKFEGYGESRLLYDNSLPEGRFYCRTVEVNVETPVE